MILAYIDSRTRLEAKIRRLIPVDWNASTNLHEGHFLAVVFDDLLCFTEVRYIALFVNAAAEESSSGALRRASRDEDPREVMTIDAHLVDGDN